MVNNINKAHKSVEAKIDEQQKLTEDMIKEELAKVGREQP